MEIILSANEKGGVAKTTTVLCLANCLTALGYKVLAVDMDPSGNMTRAALPENPVNVLYDVFKMKCAIQDAIVHTDICDILPTVKDEDDTDPSPLGGFAMASQKERKSLGYLQNEWLGKKYSEQWLNSLLRTTGLDKLYDFILVDSPPADNLLVTNCIVAADSVIVPCEPTTGSVDGLKMFISSINAAHLMYRTQVKVDGILFSKYSENWNTRKKVSADISRMAKDAGIYVYDTKFRSSAPVETSMNLCRPILDYVNQGTGAYDAMNIALEFLAKRDMEPRSSYPGVFRGENNRYVFRKNGSKYYTCDFQGQTAQIQEHSFRISYLEDAGFREQIGKSVFFDRTALESALARDGFSFREDGDPV